MPELIEQMYCSRQIVIPPKFPYILKRYAKAAIKTQPYDLLRWSFEYFKALAEDRTPPVKLRLEYPVFNTEGGLTRGYLKVLACQLEGVTEVPQSLLRTIWCGSCLDLLELKRILCLCEVYNELGVKKWHFIGVAAGLLTKSLTHTMILLCETLSKEPEGGSAAIPVEEFLMMYRFLAQMDASKNVPYINGYREGTVKREEEEEDEGQEEEQAESASEKSGESDEFWQDSHNLQRLNLINDLFDRSIRLSDRLTKPAIGPISRSPSAERAGQIDRDNFTRERKGRPGTSESVDKQLQQMGSVMIFEEAKKEAAAGAKRKSVSVEESEHKVVKIVVTDEAGEEIPWHIYGDPDEEEPIEGDLEEMAPSGKEQAAAIVAQFKRDREMRITNLKQKFSEIAEIVDKYNSANYDLGMVAGRQMSTTSGEFIVQYIERDMMAVVDEQIAVLPDPDLKKKRAKPEEVMMIRAMVDQYISENMHVIVHEEQELEEEDIQIPEIITVYAVPGIGPPVDREIVREFEEYARDVARIQAVVIMPRNIRHYLCPPLEKFVEHDYKSFRLREEEVPTAGVITE